MELKTPLLPSSSGDENKGIAKSTIDKTDKLVTAGGAIIYIRHAHDEKSRYKFDEELSEHGKKKAREVAKKLIKRHGVPDIIYFSPMHRTRQTAKEFQAVIKSHLKREGKMKREDTLKQKMVEIKVEPRIGRLFTSKEQKEVTYEKDNIVKSALRTSTKHREPIMDKDKLAFRKRIEQQFFEITTNQQNKKEVARVSGAGGKKTAETSKVIWNVTHSLVLLHVARLNNIKRSKTVEYLDTLVIDPKRLVINTDSKMHRKHKHHHK